jgi:transcriptional regulator with XRE-family HTH domain
MYLKENIRFIRKQYLKQTQERFAEFFGVTRQTISQYEGGYAQPDIEFLLKLEEVSKVPFRLICLKILHEDDFAKNYSKVEIAHVQEEKGEYKTKVDERLDRIEEFLKKKHDDF